MSSFTINQQVDAPPERVFALYADVGNAAKYIDGIERVELLSDGPVGVGTRFKETRRMFNREATEEMEFTHFEPPRRYVVRCDAHGAIYESTFDFTPSGSGTEVQVKFEARPQSLFAKLLSPLSGLMMKPVKKCTEQDLLDIKKHAEAAA